MNLEGRARHILKISAEANLTQVSNLRPDFPFKLRKVQFFESIRRSDWIPIPPTSLSGGWVQWYRLARSLVELRWFCARSYIDRLLIHCDVLQEKGLPEETIWELCRHLHWEASICFDHPQTLLCQTADCENLLEQKEIAELADHLHLTSQYGVNQV